LRALATVMTHLSFLGSGVMLLSGAYLSYFPAGL
jgi:hypothetical protein